MQECCQKQNGKQRRLRQRCKSHFHPAEQSYVELKQSVVQVNDPVWGETVANVCERLYRFREVWWCGAAPPPRQQPQTRKLLDLEYTLVIIWVLFGPPWYISIANLYFRFVSLLQTEGSMPRTLS